jgi:drug/metabolite transporter (DMT)-like permease
VPSDARRGRTYVALAALAWSSAGVLQRELSVDTGTQLSARALFALLGLLVFVLVQERAGTIAAFRSIGAAGVGFAVSIAFSSATFIVALNHTTVANVLFMQAAAPVAAALLARVALGEEVTRTTWVAMAVALVGVGIMVGGPGKPSLGVLIAIAMMLGFAVSLVFARARSDISMAPATCLAQLLVFVGAAPFATWDQIGGRDLGLLAALGVGQIGLGLAFLTLGARLIPAAEVALITLLEVVLGPLWVWIAQGEQPATATIVGGTIVVLAVAVQVSGSALRRAPAPSALPSPHP